MQQTVAPVNPRNPVAISRKITGAILVADRSAKQAKDTSTHLDRSLSLGGPFEKSQLLMQHVAPVTSFPLLRHRESWVAMNILNLMQTSAWCDLIRISSRFIARRHAGQRDRRKTAGYDGSFWRFSAMTSSVGS
ncbi:hypothetical protein M3J09_006579 [Ascochyta lentis]